jgi:hypothetical protein
VSAQTTCAGCPTELPPTKPGSGRRRKWCSDDCRKQTLYKPPPCNECGSPRRYTGRPPSSGRCAVCEAAWSRANTRRWILDSFAEWFAIFGAPPVAYNWNQPQAMAMGHRAAIERYESTGRPWPQVTTVQHHFGSWSKGVAAAGFVPLAPGHRVGEEPWPRERIIAALQAWHAEHGSAPGHRQWKRATPTTPCAHTVAYHFGSWNAGILAAGLTPRVNARNAKLTAQQAGEIRNSGEGGVVLAARFGVSTSTISQIRNGYTWREAA